MTSLSQVPISKSTNKLSVNYYSFFHWKDTSVDLKKVQLEYLGIDKPTLLWLDIYKIEA